MEQRMVPGTHRDEVRHPVRTPAGSELDMVDLDVARIPAARHHAAMVVAREHLPAQPRSDCLDDARGCWGLHVAEELAVTHDTVELGRRYIGDHAAAVLRRRPALLTHHVGDL